MLAIIDSRLFSVLMLLLLILNLLRTGLIVDLKPILVVFQDPKIFNYLVMVLYALNITRWGFHGSLKDVCYWVSALAITATVTFLYEH